METCTIMPHLKKTPAMTEQLTEQSDTRRNPYQVGLRTVLLAFVAAALVFGVLRVLFYEVEGTDQSYQDAQKVELVAMYLPEEASRINYWTSPRRWLIMANFRVSEDDFLAWAGQQGWELERIDAPRRGREVLQLYQRVPGRSSPTRSAVIRDGYTARRVSKDRKELDQVVAYDRADHRAYFSQVPR
jgi:hypothetical protein